MLMRILCVSRCDIQVQQSVMSSLYTDFCMCLWRSFMPITNVQVVDSQCIVARKDTSAELFEMVAVSVYGCIQYLLRIENE